MPLACSSKGARRSACSTSKNGLETASDETLCRQWRDRHDISAARRLAERYRNLVFELVEIYAASGAPWNDLAGEAQLGLMRAMCRFEPHQGVGFAAYATWCITANLQQYIQNSPRAFGRPRIDLAPTISASVGHARKYDDIASAGSLEHVTGAATNDVPHSLLGVSRYVHSTHRPQRLLTTG